MNKLKIEDIGSLTDFHRNSKAHLKQLRLTGRPEVLTLNGKAEVVVQDAAAYQRLLSRLERVTNALRACRTDRVESATVASDRADSGSFETSNHLTKRSET